MFILLVMWALWALFTAVVMVVDRNMRAVEDFTPSPAGYFILAAITPVLVLPVYFFASRRNSTGATRALAAAAGLLLTVPCFVLADAHTVAMLMLARVV